MCSKINRLGNSSSHQLFLLFHQHEAQIVIYVTLIDRYDVTTGVFTVPPSGDGLYYFSTYLLVWTGKVATFNLVVNNVIFCTAQGDHSVVAIDNPQAACSAMAQLSEGIYLLS